MSGRRATDRPAEPGLLHSRGLWFAFGVLLVLVVSRCAYAGAEARMIVHDDATGTRIVIAPLTHLHYGGADDWRVLAGGTEHTGDLVSLTYRAVGSDHYRATVEYTTVVPDRIFGAGFWR